MLLKRLAKGAICVCAAVLSACSGARAPVPAPAPSISSPSSTPSPVGQTPSPTAKASGSADPTATPASNPTLTPTPAATPTASPVPTPSPTPVATVAPAITGSLSSISVCAEVTTTCPDDLDPNATSGEEAAILVKGVLGDLTYSNAGGTATATLTSQVYASMGSQTEYEVFYKSGIATPTTDTLTISDSGSKSSLTIPVTIFSPGNDAGPGEFQLDTSSGYTCPGHEQTFGTLQQGNATIVLSESNPNLISISQSGSGNFILTFLEAGSGTVTATAGTSTVIYPVNIPATGFDSNC